MKGMCSAESIEKMISISENHPYYMQMMGHYLWEYAKQQKRSIDPAKVETVVKDILQRESMFFTELWDGLSSRERHLLKAIASDETTSVYEKKFIMTHHLGNPSMVQKAAQKLLQADYIRKLSNGKLTLINPLFKVWITTENAAPY
jgi:hypothetical protein